MSLNIEAYGGKDRQHAQQIMEQCIDAGLDLKGCFDAVYTEISIPTTNKQKTCPWCERELTFVRVSKREGVIICTNRKKGKAHVGCRYSEYMEIK